MPIRTRVIAALLVMAATLASTAIYATHFQDRFTVDNDFVWLHLTGARIGRVTEVDVLLDRVIGKLEIMGETAAVAKAQLLRNYMDNYIGVSALYAAGSVMLGSRDPDLASRYPAYMGRSMGLGFPLAFGVALALVMGAVVWRGSLESIAIVAFALVGMALSETLIPGTNQYLVNGQGAAQVAEQAGRFFVNPSFNFSPFGLTPRSHFALLLVPVFTLRMAGRYGASYVVVALLALVHQTYAGLLLGLVGSLDFVLRPGVLLRRDVWMPVVIAVAVFVIRERVWQVIGAPVAVTLLSLGLAVAAAAALVASRRPRLKDRLIAGGTWWGATTAPGWRADVLLISTFWIISVPVSYYLTRVTSGGESLYLWSQLSGRSMGLVRPSLFLAGAAGIVSLLRRSRSMVPWSVAAGLCLLAAGYVSSRIPGDPRTAVREVSAGLTDMDRGLAAPSAKAVTGEGIVYYAVSKSVELGQDALAPLVR